VRVIGHGGMGSVYEARHVTTDKRVAVKLLAAAMSKDLKLVARFRREAMAASRLEHENCVHVDDFGEDGDGTFYITMELVDGVGLGEELRRVGPMPQARVSRIAFQLVKALDAAHASGVLHRDLKPQNVMVMQKPNRPDIVKVVDFGIAKLTTSSPEDQGALTIPGTIFGTPEYMSPEQARGETLDARSDIYSAGVVLWHLLLGRSPFRGATVRETLMKVFTDTAPSPARERPEAGIAPGFEAVLAQALAKKRDDRYPDAASFLAALSPYVSDVLYEVPRGALPGLAVDGGAPPPTIGDSTPRNGRAAGKSDLKQSATVALPVEPVVQVTKPPLPLAPTVPSAAKPLSAKPTLVEHPSAPPLPSAAPPQTTPQPTSVPVQAVPPKAPAPATKVITFDAVKKSTGALPLADEEPTAKERPKQSRISPYAAAAAVAFVVLVGGAGAFVAMLLNGKFEKSGQVVDLSEPDPITSKEQPLAPSRTGPLEIDPLARDAALTRGERALDGNNLADARKAFEEAMQADDTSPRAQAGLAVVAYRQGDLETAKASLERVMATDETYRRQFQGMYAIVKKRLASQAP
jgi:serine/threonine protein kinase